MLNELTAAAKHRPETDLCCLKGSDGGGSSRVSKFSDVTFELHQGIFFCLHGGWGGILIDSIWTNMHKKTEMTEAAYSYPDVNTRCSNRASEEFHLQKGSVCSGNLKPDFKMLKRSCLKFCHF